MARETKKKRRIGLTIFLIILALIILLPIGLYIYLKAEHFPIAEMRDLHSYADTYSGYREYENGQVSLQLDEAELYWLAENYGLSDMVLPLVTIDDYAVELDGSCGHVYADLKLANFLPIPVYAKISLAEASDDEAAVNIEEIKLGKSISVPLTLIERFGVDLNFILDLNEDFDGYRITELALSDSLLHVSIEMKQSYASLIAPDHTADTLFLYGEQPNEILSAASALYKTRFANTYDVITTADDPTEMITHLLAMSPHEPENVYWEQLSEVDRRYILPLSTEEVALQRDAYNSQIAAYNRKLQMLLDKIREHFKALRITLAQDGYLDNTTGEPFSVAAIVPELELQDDQCRLILLTATIAHRKPASLHMPYFSEIPKKGGFVVADAINRLPYDLGLMMPLASGEYAMVYYTSAGEIVIHCIPDAMVENMLADYAVPTLLNLDNAVYGITLTTKKAPAHDLRDYIVYLPDAVEDVYQANFQEE